MEGMLAAEAAVLVELETIGIVLLVLEGVVVPLLALGAGQCDLDAHVSNSPLIVGSAAHAPCGRGTSQLPITHTWASCTI